MRVVYGLVITIAATSLQASVARADDEDDDFEPVAEAREVARPADAADAARTLRAADTVRRAQIAHELAEVRDEEASTTRLWPILTVAAGTAAVATGATSGAIAALSCDGSCRSGGWQGATVLIGAAVATIGVLWLRWTNADLDELDSRRYRLERERDDLDKSVADAPARALAARGRTVALSLHARF